MKKIFIIGIPIVLLIALVIFFLSGLGKKKQAAPDNSFFEEPIAIPTRPIEEYMNERPYVSLVPTADGHWVTLEIKRIAKGFSKIEYDLLYYADAEGSRIERGISTGGLPVELSGSEYSKKVLFGSASCTTGICKYRYDENVNEGSFSLKLVGSSVEKYDTTYRIQKSKEAAEGFTAGDEDFSFKSNSVASGLYLTISTIGVPAVLPNGVVAKSVPYGIFPAITAKGTVAFKTNLTEGNIYSYNGKNWQKLTTKIASGEATAETSGAYLFILTQ
ncbi:hypothetical protein KKA69_00350 [Patescibacteria group bacterium]|nr:hypothetical protein [Patescibacteria group bacterium]